MFTQYSPLLFDPLVHEFLNTLSPTQIFEMLKRKDAYGWTLAIRIARLRDTATNQKLLQLLASLSQDQLFTLLQRQEQQNWSMGMFIARHQNAITTQKFLELLTSLTQDQLFTLLQQHEQQNWSMGMLIARYQDAITTQQFLRLLGTLRQDQSFELLQQQDRDGWTLGMKIARNQDAATIQFFQLLEPLTSDQLFRLLQQHDQQGWTFGVILAYNQNTNACKTYLSFLEEKIISHEQLFTLLTHKSAGYTLESIIKQKSDSSLYKQYMSLLVKALYSKLKTGIPLSDELYKECAKYKSALIEYIDTLEQEERTQALLNAKDKNHALGRLMWVQQGLFKPNEKSGSLKVINSKLNSGKPPQNTSSSPFKTFVEKVMVIFNSPQKNKETELNSYSPPPPYHSAHSVIQNYPYSINNVDNPEMIREPSAAPEDPVPPFYRYPLAEKLQTTPLYADNHPIQQNSIDLSEFEKGTSLQEMQEQLDENYNDLLERWIDQKNQQKIESSPLPAVIPKNIKTSRDRGNNSVDTQCRKELQLA